MLNKMLHLIRLAVLVGIVSFTCGLAAQPLSTTDTVQNLEIARALDNSLDNSKRIDALASSITDLQGSVNRGIGIGIGIGLTMTLLQIVSIVSNRRNDGPRLKERY